MAGYDNVPDYEIKRQIVEVAQMMNRKGLVGTYEGNISVRKGNKVYEDSFWQLQGASDRGQDHLC